MASPLLPNNSSTGFPIALLVCIIVAVTVFVILMVIALHYYLLRRRHQHELRDRNPRSAIYIAPTNFKVKPPLQLHERPLPASHTRILTPPVLPQLRLQSPFTSSKPTIPAQPNPGVVSRPPPLKFSNSNREQNHLVVPISSFSQHRDRLARFPHSRVDSYIAPTEYNDNHKPGEDEDDGEREEREVVNKFFAAAVGKREREPNVQMGRWRTSTRERAILASDSSTLSVAGVLGTDTRSSTTEDSDKKPREDRWSNRGSGREGREGGLGRLSGGEARGPLCLKGKWGPHGFVPAPLAVVRKDRLGEEF